MLAAAGAAALNEWAEGAFLLFLFSLGHAGETYALDRARTLARNRQRIVMSWLRIVRDFAVRFRKWDRLPDCRRRTRRPGACATSSN